MAHANTDEFLTLRLSMLGLYKFLVHSFIIKFYYLWINNFLSLLDTPHTNLIYDYMVDKANP